MREARVRLGSRSANDAIAGFVSFNDSQATTHTEVQELKTMADTTDQRTKPQIATHIKSYKPGSCAFGPQDTLPAYTRC
uniref:Uncharacterized protein n=1 Tax=Phytophthora fragariae TaxID=53985 RepID=A0A6A3EI02_9STRA|nr:hypothetical protein PF009_g16668 [Phytophthora fragariae]